MKHVVIGMDPHKRSVTIEVITGAEHLRWPGIQRPDHDRGPALEPVPMADGTQIEQVPASANWVIAAAAAVVAVCATGAALSGRQHRPARWERIRLSRDSAGCERDIGPVPDTAEV